ncbi:Protein-lysine N-methyltransferase efm6 [Coemansia sp. RSA 1813]|nr:Protein-lysine N-methyltransferase efm6 [Coemansia sp. RSA 1646]KAJ1773412.1 Protein-lysine N-methyltransferase efm6 [Coemansia sp. RSA 1843]KAJ2091335.1 Protein-lysine N-methyltransferase efm6 [Coemansia sp. RSA 986]KAJ2216526.1 Protein-lysine N-methyltransferase efm6 [Coemansia sp. RSA 487]KAJ2571393.1 Protein-lysine N-methyltransferase efm6 [Coemansia sp. RSA 1813]
MDFDGFIDYELEISRADASPVRVLQDATGSAKCGIGSTVWDAGIVLAKYLDWQISKGNMDLSGKTVLELGAGTGIVGIALACMQPECSVVLSDKEELVSLLERNIALNNTHGNVSAVCLDWSNPEHRQNVSAAPDLILVSDGIWIKDLHSHLADTLAQLAGSSTTVLLAYETRKFDEEAQFMAQWSSRFRFHDIKPQDQHPVMQSEDIFLFSGCLKT